jgi:hypothetical protein
MTVSEEEDSLASAQFALTESAKAILLMIAKMEDRETRMRASIDSEILSLRNEVAQVRGEVAILVRGASAQIAEEARQALAPVAAHYNRAVSSASTQLKSASKTVWLWFASGAAVLLLCMVVGWMVLGFYRRELADAKEQLQNYKDALPTLQAFDASDAAVCGGRLCVNADPNGPRFGDKRQYHQARPRPQQ